MLSNGVFFIDRLIQNEPTLCGLFDGTVWSIPQVLDELSESGPLRRYFFLKNSCEFMKLHTIHVNVWFVRYNLIIHFCRLDSRVSMSTTNVSTHKGRLFLAYDSCRCFKKFCSNVSEYSSMARFGFSPKSCTRRKWASEAQWHLKPFSSRHCFSHSWQYQRSFCRPFDFNCFVATLLAVWWTITFSCEVEVIPSTSNVYLLHAATKIQDVKRADKTFFGHGAECSNSWNFGEFWIA